MKTIVITYETSDGDMETMFVTNLYQDFKNALKKLMYNYFGEPVKTLSLDYQTKKALFTGEVLMEAGDKYYIEGHVTEYITI